MDYVLFHIFLILFLMIFSAFFSASETALFSLKKAELHKFSVSSNYIERAIAASLMEPDKILITILLGNLFVNIMLSSFTTSIMLKYFTTYGHIISILVITPLIIVFCEITPKIITIYFHKKFSKISFPLLQVFHKITFPLRKVIMLFTDFFIKIFNLELKHSIITEDELDHVVEKGEEQGIIDKKESDIIKNVMRFSKREASNIMYPRNQAIFISKNCSIDEAMKIINDNDIVRVPVYKNDLDDIIGVVDARDIISPFMGYNKVKKIDKYIKPVDFFPFSKDLNELLNDFLLKKIQIAVIVDEYGGTAGIVTLNSILSAILGKEFGK
ncbi:MAG: hemolysin family protein, partial [Spirochaetota bacterium]